MSVSETSRPVANQLSTPKLFSILLVAFSLTAGVGSAFLLSDMGPLIWLPFAFALPAALLHTGSAFLVWNGLKGFKAELRKAYLFICIAVVFVGFTQLQLPIISILGLWELRENGIIIIPFVLPFIFFLIGVRRFARLLNIHTLWTSEWFVSALGLALGGLIILLPHAPNDTPPLTFSFNLLLLSWIAVHALALMIVVLRIKKMLGTRYVNALAWLWVTYASVLATTLLYLITLLVTSPGNWFVDYNISVAAFIIVGLFWVRAGYAFNAVTAAQPSKNHLGRFFGPAKQEFGQFPSVDIIIHAAGQASDIKPIDAILDDLRTVTASIGGRSTLTPEQQQELAKVYLKLEDFLIANDRLREFSKTNLREDIELSFPQTALQNSFWPIIKRPLAQ